MIKGVIILNMGHQGGALTQEDWCPLGTGEQGHRHAHMNDPPKTQGEDGRLRSKERGFRRNQPFRHLDLRLQPRGQVGPFEPLHSAGHSRLS